MENESIVLMLKNPDTGFLEKEMAIIDIADGAELITSVYVCEEDDTLYVHMKLTCGSDVPDGDFDRVYDAYGDDCDFEGVDRIIEEDDCYNPTWDMIFEYNENREVLEEKFARIIEMHKSELDRIL